MTKKKMMARGPQIAPNLAKPEGEREKGLYSEVWGLRTPEGGEVEEVKAAIVG
jgi:hypothetical protein